MHQATLVCVSAPPFTPCQRRQCPQERLSGVDTKVTTELPVLRVLCQCHCCTSVLEQSEALSVHNIPTVPMTKITTDVKTCPCCGDFIYQITFEELVPSPDRLQLESIGGNAIVVCRSLEQGPCAPARQAPPLLARLGGVPGA